MPRSFTLVLVCVLLNMISGVTALNAADEIAVFDNPDQSDLYHALLKEYRCLKCQNQNLADSNASLAGDLRREIRDQILAGMDKQDIDLYLVARYGEFVLYRPRFSTRTAFLWIGPFALLLIALTALYFMVRRRSRAVHDAEEAVPDDSELSAIEQEKLDKARRLLAD